MKAKIKYQEHRMVFVKYMKIHPITKFKGLILGCEQIAYKTWKIRFPSIYSN